MLEVIAKALNSPSSNTIHDGYYQNEQGEWGYYVTVWDAGHYHMISVSHIDRVMPPHEIAQALLSSSAQIHTDGRYRNKKGTLGYYATVRNGDHWYMISVSDLLQPFHRQWWIDHHEV